MNFLSILSSVSFVVESHFVAEIDLKLKAILLPPEYWDYKCEQPFNDEKKSPFGAENGDTLCNLMTWGGGRRLAGLTPAWDTSDFFFHRQTRSEKNDLFLFLIKYLL